jgi:hypothetical protein
VSDRITSEAVSYGHELYLDGTHKLATVVVEHHADPMLRRGEAAVLAALPRGSQTIHWCKTNMTLDEARAVIDACEQLRGG